MTSVIGFLPSSPVKATPLAEQDLDQMKRIETSEPLSRFVSSGGEPVRQWRDGLGEWVGFVLSGAEGRIIVATAATGEDGFGASIWLPPRMSFRAAARIARSHMKPGKAPRFITEDGRPVRLPA